MNQKPVYNGAKLCRLVGSFISKKLAFLTGIAV